MDPKRTEDQVFDSVAALFGVLARRREGAQMYCHLQSERVATLCRALCNRVAIEFDSESDMAPTDRLVHSALR